MKHDPDFMEKFSRHLEARKAAARILEVKESADLEKIKKAYRRAAVKYHPDHNGNTSRANQRFVLVQCAYELLAFDKPCDRLLEEIDSWPGVPGKGKYRTDNPWGHFLWWREKFFESEQKNRTKKRNQNRSCI